MRRRASPEATRRLLPRAPSPVGTDGSRQGIPILPQENSRDVTSPPPNAERPRGSRPERWAVTGATGLVGRAFLRRLAGAEVAALCRRAPPPQDGQDGAAPIRWVRGSLGDEASLARLVERADVVVHVAGLTAGTPAALHAVNVAGAAAAARAARAAGAARFVHVSSLAARAPHLSAYARSKALSEAAVRDAAGPMPIRIVRPPAVIGPDDAATAPLVAALRRGVLPVPGGAGWRARRLSLVTADDLADALARVATGDESGAGPVTPATVPAFGWADLAEAGGARALPLPPALLRLVGRSADAARRLGLAGGVFGLGKARELLHDDWSVTETTEDPAAALAAVLRAYLPADAPTPPSREEPAR